MTRHEAKVSSARVDIKQREPARYFPFANGRYEVKAGLHRFGADFGNGAAEGCVFQLDRQFDRFRSVKLAARAEALQKYVLTDGYPDSAAQAVTRFIAQRLATEYPRWFALSPDGGRWRLACTLTGEDLTFDRHWQLEPQSSRIEVTPPYDSSLDALAGQIQEDLAVMSIQNDRHKLAALHVCMPGHWAPTEKIGRTFAQIHAPVPQMQAINARQQHYVHQMVNAENGLVRFVWGCQSDDRLNGHPDAPHHNEEHSAGRAFDPGQTFLRMERQVIWGLSQAGAALFTIRPYLVAIREIRSVPELRRALISALCSMEPDALAYKRLNRRDALVDWLS